MIEKLVAYVKAFAFSTVMLQTFLIFFNIPSLVNKTTGLLSKAMVVIFMMWFVASNIVIMLSFSRMWKKEANEKKDKGD